MESSSAGIGGTPIHLHQYDLTVLSYFLTLTVPTTIRQKFEFDTDNGFTASNLNIRSSLALVITKMSQ